jgi:hypothetical protein
MYEKLDQFGIIGSGPAALAAVWALREAGARPILFCVQRRADREYEERSVALRRTLLTGGRVPREQESYSERELHNASGGQLGKKSWFGSTHMYQSSITGVSFGQDVIARPSYAAGGFSTVWGATLRGFHSSTWPSEIRPSEDVIDSVWRYFERRGIKRRGNGLCNESLSQIVRLREKTLGTPFHIHEATNAIASDHCLANSGLDCGRCLMGCPTSAIFSSDEEISELHRRGELELIHGEVVHISEDSNSANVEIIRADKSRSRFRVAKLLVAAGSLGTPVLLVRSNLRSRITVRDSQTFFGVGFDYRHLLTRSNGIHHGLSQWWLTDGVDKPAGVFLQGYPRSRFHADKLPRSIGPVPIPLRARVIASNSANPLILYLDQSSSGSLVVTKTDEEVNVLVDTPHNQVQAHETLQEITSLLRRAHILSVPKLFRPATVGEGYHMGASLSYPQETDQLGRLRGSSRIHVIDGSVLPKIEAGPITLSVMINAFRIASSL